MIRSTLALMPMGLRYQLHHWRHRSKHAGLRTSTGDYSLAGFDRLKCIFVHIPKAGGVSINRALFGNLGGAHRTVDDYLRIFGPIRYDRYFSFSFVRNPYSRLLSAYTFLKAGGYDDVDRAWSENNLSSYREFDEFVHDWLTPENIWTKLHFMPQYHFLSDYKGDLRLDMVARFETMSADFQSVCRRLGVKRELAHHNRTERRSSVAELYTAAARERVASVYDRDFELFGYDPDVIGVE